MSRFNKNVFIKSKKQLKDLVDKNLIKYPVINKYFSNTIKNIISKMSLLSSLEIRLVRYVAIDYSSLNKFEKFIEDRSFTNIQSPLSRLRSNLDEYHSVLSELEAAVLLKNEGMTDIKFLSQAKSNPDIEYKEDGIIKYAEVKGFMEINPDFTIINDKFEAKSLRSQIFKRTFIISCEYKLFEFNSIEKLHNDIKTAVDSLIRKLTPLLKEGNVEDLAFKIGKITFVVTSKPNGRKESLILFSGGGIFYGQTGDVFLQLSSVYTRIIRTSRIGYLQLLKKRDWDRDVVKKDRLYLFLNVDRFAFFGDKIKPVFNNLSKVLGISDIVDLKLQK